MNSDIRRLADLAGVTLTEHTLPPARSIRMTLSAVGLDEQDATVVESAVKIAVGQLSIAVSDYKVDRDTGTIVVYPKITPQGISAQQLNESKEELIQILSSPSTVRRARGVSESADSKHPSEATVARDLKARYGEANYSSKATGSTHKVIHDGNYYRSGMMRSKTLSGLLNLIDKKVNNKAPATGTMTIHRKGVKEGKEDLELYGLRIGNTVKADVDGRKVQGDVIDIFPETMEVELLLRGARAGKTVTVHVHDTEFLSEQRVRAGTVKENLNTRAIKIPLEDVGLKDVAIPDVQVYVDAAVEAQDVLNIDNWEISHFADLLFYTVGDDQPAAAEIRSFGKAMVAYLTDPENVNGAIAATDESEKEECDEVDESLTEISVDLRNRYVKRASDDYGSANFAARAATSHPGLEDYAKEQARRRDRRRAGLNRALSDKRTGREPANEGNRGDYGYPSFSVAKARELCASGNWEAMSDIKPGSRVEMRNTRTGKRTTVQITESIANSNLGHVSSSTTDTAPKGGQYEAVHESHVTKSGTTNVFGYLDLRTGTTTLTHTVDGTLTEAAVKRHLEDVRFPLN